MFQYLTYKLAHFLAMNLQLRHGYGLASFIAKLQYLLSRNDRLIVYANLRAIFPGEDEKEIKRLAKEVFVNFAKYLTDFFRFEKLDRGYIDSHVKIAGAQNLDDALKRGKGVVTLTAHIGNYELGGAVISLLGYKFNAVALNHKEKKVNDLFVSQRARAGINVIPLGAAVKKCYEALKKGEIVALVGDRDFTPHGVKTKFFGKDALIPRGPAAFYLKAGVAIVPGFLIRMPDDTFELRFEKPISYTATGDEQLDEQRVTEMCLRVIEGYIRKYPSQWYMFRRFWI
ncbi:MAG: lysophospholipid acyltransferase family protein [Candidatus Omnitrophica bacterium]|nr:lysophospholipid acyltransferase family protein [Candidatus Omnitrophota bacterium]